MPYHFDTAIKLPYRTVPVPKDFIPSRPPPSSSSSFPSLSTTTPTSTSQSHEQEQTLSQEQIEAKPHILWVGCSDSSVLETECLGVRRDEVFVHRNLGNILSNGDLSSASAVEWGVGLLKVDHIIVCGHYDCALIDKGDGSALGGWHKNITKLHALNETHMAEKHELDNYCRHRKLEEVYVLAEVGWLRKQESVKRAMEGGLQVHGFVWDGEKGGCVMLVEG